MEIRSVGNQENQNLIIKAAKECKPDVLKVLIKQAFDIDYEDKDNFIAIDYAWASYLRTRTTNDPEAYLIYNEIVLALLNANSRYPEDKTFLTSNYYSTELKKFVEDHQKLHDYLENHNYSEFESKLTQMPYNLCHFYDINNVSLMNHAMQNYNENVYEMLSSRGITLGSHEDPDEVFENLKNHASRITNINQNSALELPKIHIHTIVSKLRVTNNCSDQNRHRSKDIMDALIRLDGNKYCSKVLKVVAACKRLKIFLDFKYEAVNFIDPSSSGSTLGLTTSSGVIRIGAKKLLTESTRNEVIGVLIHEFCHLAMLMTFLNKFKPYSVGDEDMKKKYEDVVEECRQNKDHEVLISGVFEYVEAQQHGELIVRFLHMIMEYYGINEPDGTTKISTISKIFPKLFEYFEETVAPALDKVLNILKVLQNDDDDHKVSYEDLTQPQKNRIKYRTNSFQGTETTMFDMLGNGEEIYKHLTKMEVKYYLFNMEADIFESIKINADFARIERRFILESGDNNQNNVNGFTLVKENLEQQGVFLLIDQAGAGKSEAFIDLSKRLKSEYKNYLVHLVDVKKYEAVFSKWTPQIPEQNNNLYTETLKKILLEILKLKSEFEKQIFQKLFSRNKVIFLFDGVDKLKVDSLNFFIKMMLLWKEAPVNEEGTTVNRCKILISSCPTTMIRNKMSSSPVCERSYKLVPYSSEERISCIYDIIPDINQSEKLEELVWYIWFFNIIENPKETTNSFTNVALIKILMKQHTDANVDKSKQLFNVYVIFNYLYQPQDLVINHNDQRCFNLLKILQVYALSSSFGTDVNFSRLKCWNKEKDKWKSHEFEGCGYIYVNPEEDTDKVNNSNFIHKTCADYFATAFLINLLSADNFDIKDIEFENLVKCLRIIGNKPMQFRMIQKLLLAFVKMDGITFFEEAKNKLRNKIPDIRNDIIDSPNLVDSLKFWSVLLSKDVDALNQLWQPEDDNNLLKQVILSNQNTTNNFIKILKIVSTSFGDNWHTVFLSGQSMIFNLHSPQNDNGCEGFNKNLQIFILFLELKYNQNEIFTIFSNVLTNPVVVQHINLNNIKTCLRICREKFEDDEDFFILIFSRFLNFTIDPEVLRHYGLNLRDTLRKNEESIRKVLFCEGIQMSRPLILTSMSEHRDIFTVYKDLYKTYDSDGTYIQNYFNKNHNFLDVFFLMTEENIMEVIEYLVDIYASNHIKLIESIENVKNEQKINLICNNKRLDYFTHFLSKVFRNFYRKNTKVKNIFQELYFSRTNSFNTIENTIKLNNENVESITKLYLVYNKSVANLSQYFIHKCELPQIFCNFSKNCKLWMENNNCAHNSGNLDLFVKFGSKFYKKNKKEFDQVVAKALKSDDELIMKNIIEQNLNERKKIEKDYNKYCSTLENRILS